MSIFARLQFDGSFQGNNTTEMSDSVKNHMNTMPQMLNSWQKQDLADSNAGGYFQNPVITITNSIWGVANGIIGIANLASSNVTQVYSAANTLFTSANNFMQHTNRISGVSGTDPDNPSLPTYQSAIGAGKLVSYIVYQSDGIQNNAPLIGSFTSLYTSNNLTSYYITIQNYATTVQNSLNVSTYQSNLTQTQANTIASNIANVALFMDTRRNADLTFYTNSQLIVSDYNKVRTFSNMGQTETDLTNNLI